MTLKQNLPLKAFATELAALVLLFAATPAHASNLTCPDIFSAALAHHDTHIVSDDTIVKFETRKAHYSEPRLLTPDRWPSNGRQAALDPAQSHYLSPVERQWAALSGTLVPRGFMKTVSDLAARVRSSKYKPETYEKVYLSPDQKFAITYSSKGITRIHRADDMSSLLATIPYGGYIGGYEEGILAVTNEYFVLNQGLANKPAGGNIYATVRRFDSPEKIEIEYYNGNQNLPGVHFTRDNSKVIFTTLSYVNVFDLKTGAEKTIFPREKDDYISTSRLADDGHTLLIGFTRYGTPREAPSTLMKVVDIANNLVSPPVRLNGMYTVSAFVNLHGTNSVTVLGEKRTEAARGNTVNSVSAKLSLPKPSERVRTSDDYR